MTASVKKNSAVLAHYTLKLEDGSIAESTRVNGKPALFRLGDSSLSQELEQAMLGLRRGDKRSFHLSPGAIFGAASPDMIHYFSRADFAQTEAPDVGTIMLFSLMDGSERPGVIRGVSGDAITVDFNHPLAGQPLQLDIEILALDPVLEAIHANSVG